MSRFRFKHFLRERNEYSTTGEETLLSVSEYYGVRPRSDAFEGDAGESRAASLEGYRIVKPGDLVMNYMLAWKGAYGLSNFDGITSPAYAVFDVDAAKVDRRYLHHRTRSQDMQIEFRARSKGIIESRLRLYPDALLAMEVELPDLPTQKRIAAFLDRETARIDELIAKKELFEKAVEADFAETVTSAVIFGISGARHLKATGYAWQPETPTDWTVTRLKFLCSRIVDCLHETPVHEEEGEYPSIRTADVIRGGLLIDQAKRVMVEEYTHRIQRLVPEENDVVYTREGERFGLAALVPPNTPLCLGQRMMMFRVNQRALPGYLMWSLNGGFAYHHLRQGTTGATSPHLNISDIRNVPIYLPPLEEQCMIVDHLNAKFQKKQSLCDASRKTIDRLREYRAALITEAVTGQLDVDNYGKSGATSATLDQIEEEMQA